MTLALEIASDLVNPARTGGFAMNMLGKLEETRFILANLVQHATIARMIPRQKSQLVRARLDQFPAVALLGPR
jgi:hypothetical protein